MDKEQKCPFCRVPASTSDKEMIKRVMKRVQVGDAQAINNLGCCYAEGIYGLPQDYAKALELWHQAGELGCAASYNNIGFAHDNGEGVERNEKKAIHYYQLAAMRGNSFARHNLGDLEKETGNTDRALKHFMIAVESGDNESLKEIKELCKDGNATKDDYAKALKAYQAYLSEIKSDDRDEAAAFNNMNRYY